jgi:hypothetical protein
MPIRTAFPPIGELAYSHVRSKNKKTVSKDSKCEVIFSPSRLKNHFLSNNNKNKSINIADKPKIFQILLTNQQKYDIIITIASKGGVNFGSG